MAADSVMTATAAIAPMVAKSLRTRGLATIRLMPATTMPATIPIRAVLVWVRTRTASDAATIIAVGRPRI
jgi:hypothetical protein